MKRRFFLGLFLTAVTLPVTAATARAQAVKPFLASLFSDDMVLQRGISAPVWGWAKPGEKIAVSVAGKTASAIADTRGKWMAKLPPLPVGGPYTLKATRSAQTVTLNNILVGDVWICSGQSNMEMGIGAVNDGPAEIAAANYPKIRLFSVPHATALQPTDTVNAKWTVCSPQTVGTGGWSGFSAVGYFFGRALYKELNVPIGLIHTSWGGTVAEAWVSGNALKRNMPDFVSGVAQVESAAKASSQASYETQVTEWYAKNDPGSRGKEGWRSDNIEMSGWKTMSLPTAWEAAGLPQFDGVVWFRKEVTLPDSVAGKAAVLNLGPIDDNDTTWINGTKVGSTSAYLTDRKYTVPENLLKAGRNTVAVRVLDTQGGGGFHGKPEQMTLTPTGGTPFALAGDWQYRVGVDIKNAPAYPIPLENNPNVATALYNGMIAPLVPFGIKGAIWYQGESNAGRDEQYRRLLPTLIGDWREQFGVGSFPFYIVQLANFLAPDTEPKDDPWPRLREAQYLTTRQMPGTGIATAIDIGEANDIHPKNKQEVGRRLALNALALTYGKKVVYSGPVYNNNRGGLDGNTIRLVFDHVGGGLVAKGGTPLTGFAIAGDDKKFVWADAKIEGDTILVSSPKVANPKAVRYAWSNNPVCNLYNKEGLPALPFRTDSPATMFPPKK
ncbi:MAG: 9-O-acetylesterase [Fibrella sp.]|nr:9-O-acetylesterase [Armatimonadota bacterium]